MDPASTDSPPPGASVAAPEAARPRGRRKWFVLGALGLGLAALWVFSGGGSSNRELTVTIAGFSNYMSGWPPRDAGVHAWCWVTNGPYPSTFWVTSVVERTDGRWVDRGGVGITSHERIPDKTVGPVLDPAGGAQLISFAVSSTASPVRVVLDVQEGSGGLAGLKERWQQFNYDHIKKQSRWVAGGRRYAVTNEFHPKP